MKLWTWQFLAMTNAKKLELAREKSANIKRNEVMLWEKRLGRNAQKDWMFGLGLIITRNVARLKTAFSLAECAGLFLNTERKKLKTLVFGKVQGEKEEYNEFFGKISKSYR